MGKDTVFKVGDRVVVKSDLEVGAEYDGTCTFADEMQDYAGESLTVCRVIDRGNGAIRYKLVDVYSWVFSDSMLELVTTETTETPAPTAGQSYTFDQVIKMLLSASVYVGQELLCERTGDILKVERNIKGELKLIDDSGYLTKLYSSMIHSTWRIAPAVKQMTKEDIEEQLGYNIDIIA